MKTSTLLRAAMLAAAGATLAACVTDPRLNAGLWPVDWSKRCDGAALRAGQCGRRFAAIYPAMNLARAFVIVGALALLASCGADGAPTPPTPQPDPLGLSVSGEVAFGVAKRGAD